jgi:hypothetical protein
MIEIGELRQHIILDEILYVIIDFYDLELCEPTYNYVLALIFWENSPLNGKLISGNINWFLKQTISINNGSKQEKT